MNAADLAVLTAAGAGAAVAPTNGTYPVSTPPTATIGYARQVNPDGSVTLTAFLFNGTSVSVQQQVGL